MQKIKATIISIIILMSSTQLMAARFFDGQQALYMCQATTVDMSAGCSMFIVGVAETLRMAGYNDKDYCIAETIDNLQLKQEFINYLNAHKDLLKYSATSLFYANLMNNYPCNKKK